MILLTLNKKAFRSNVNDGNKHQNLFSICILLTNLCSNFSDPIDLFNQLTLRHISKSVMVYVLTVPRAADISGWINFDQYMSFQTTKFFRRRGCFSKGKESEVILDVFSTDTTVICHTSDDICKLPQMAYEDTL